MEEMKKITKIGGVPHEDESPLKRMRKDIKIEEHRSKVPRRGEPTSRSSPTRSALSSTPRFAGGIQMVFPDGEEEIELDEVPLQHPDERGVFEEDDIEERSEDAGPHSYVQRSWKSRRKRQGRPN